MGSENRPPSDEELAGMKELVEQGMRAGACGMSTGLIYVPSSYAETDELIELSRVVADHGGIYVSHIRNEGIRLLEAVNETLSIGREANLPVHISHFKAAGRDAWSLGGEAIRLIEEARANGLAATADQYPYTASSTSLAAMVIPSDLRGTSTLTQALNDPQRASKVREGIAKGLEARNGGKTMFVASYSKNRAWQGKDLATIAAEEGVTVLELVLEIQRNGGAKMVNFCMDEEVVRQIMRQPFVATASDGGARIPDNSVPHPRSYGCFPRKIGRYSIEEPTLPLEQAIRSSSGLPADIFGLRERGYLRKGFYADIVVFAPDTFRDTATFEKPHQYSTGVRYLFVNGKLAIDDGTVTGALAGRALRHDGPNDKQASQAR
jgi:N-acyl-D-aspartate/D-glutamate deacylase